MTAENKAGNPLEYWWLGPNGLELLEPRLYVTSGTLPPVPPGPLPVYNITGTTFYVSSSSGSDSNTGTSPSAPWQSVNRAMQQNYTAGDGLLFKRGDTFYLNRIDKTPIPKGSERWTVGAYGTGPLPILSRYMILNNAANWVLHSPGIWKYNTSAGAHTGFTGPYTGNAPNSWTNVGFLMINGVAYGARKTSLGALSAQWDFYGYPDPTWLYVRSSANPAVLAADVRAAPDGRVVFTRSNTEVADLEITGCGGNGLNGPGGGVSNVVLQRNFIHHIGGSALIGLSGEPRYGNAQEFWTGTSNATVADNLIEDVYDTGLTVQGDNANSSNITWTNNTVRRCCLGFELFKGGTGTWSNIKFEYNKLYDGGGGFGGVPQPNQDRRNHVTIGPPWTPTSAISIQHNEFHGTANTSWIYFIWNNGAPGIPAGVTFDYNDFYMAPTMKMQWPRSETASQFAAWKAATGLEPHGVMHLDDGTGEAPASGTILVADYPTPQLAANAAAGKRLVFPVNTTYTVIDLLIPPGCYVEGNNSTLKFPDNSTLTTSTSDSLLSFNGSNITIDNLNFDGNSANQGATWSQHRHAIRIHGAFSNNVVKNCDMINMIGDGVYVNTQTSGPTTIGPNNTISANYNARNGVSVVTGDTVEVYGNTISTYSDDNPAMPGAIDIEPNSVTDHLAHVDVHDNTIIGGSLAGVGTITGIVYGGFNNCPATDIKIRNNNISGARLTAGVLAIGNNGGPFNAVTGIVISGNTIHDLFVDGNGVELDYWIGANVINNTISGAWYGIYNYRACLGTSTGNTFGTGVGVPITNDIPHCS